MRPFILSILSFICMANIGFAQRFESYIEVGARLGNVFLSSDVTTKGSMAPSLDIFIVKKLSPHVGLRADLGFAMLNGKDENAASELIQQRGAEFKNNIFRGGLSAEIYLVNSGKGRYYRRNYYVPYLLLGAGGIYHKPQLESKIYSLTEDQEMSNNSFITVFGQLGIGHKFFISDRMDLRLQIDYQFLMLEGADYLDGISWYGNPDNKDKLINLSAGLSYILSSRRGVRFR